MTRIELDRLLALLLKECDRRGPVAVGGIGPYSVEAPAIWELYKVGAQLTLHIMHLERQIAKLQRKKK